jgi:hypothetical protein
MALSGSECPDCGRRVREPFEQTITGREVCPDCAKALFMGFAAGAITLSRGGRVRCRGVGPRSAPAPTVGV